MLGKSQDFWRKFRAQTDRSPKRVKCENYSKNPIFPIKNSFSREFSLTRQSNNKIDGKPLYFYNNSKNLISEDFDNAGQIILISCNDSLISNFNITWAFIRLFLCNNITFFNGNITLAKQDAIKLEGCDSIIINKTNILFCKKNGINMGGIIDNKIGNNHKVVNCVIKNCTNGIYALGNGITVEKCSLINNSYGLYATTAPFFGIFKNYTITSNKFKYNIYSGLYADYITGNIISHNLFYSNYDKGIILGESTGASYDKIFGNNISENLGVGMYVLRGNNGKYYSNIYDGNGVCGLFLGIYTHNNLLNNNTFTRNHPNVINHDSSNKFNNSIIGNRWSNYTGKDIDDDGIGDTIHLVSGVGNSFDYKPIQWDAPTFTINKPSNRTKFGPNSPQFNLTMLEGKAFSYWYELNNTGQKSAPNSSLSHSMNEQLLGRIKQELWDALPDKDVLITFYINDSRNYITVHEVNLTKDSVITAVVINKPDPWQLFGNNTISYNITAFKGTNNLHTIWYTLDGGQTNFTVGTVGCATPGVKLGQINTNAWQNAGNGTVTITFYVNDTAKAVRSDSIVVRKDCAPPQVTINKPTLGETFGATSPQFELTIMEANLNVSYYLVGSNPYRNYFTANGAINQTAWTALVDGNIVIRFIINDTLGNKANLSITVKKDTSIPVVYPSILVLSPVASQLTGVSIIGYIVNLTKGTHALASAWYVINGSAEKYYLVLSGTLSQQVIGNINSTGWALLGNGTLTITFQVKDSQGNTVSSTISLRRDILSPQLTVITPISEQQLGETAPTFNISVSDPNLYQVWYAINDGDKIYITKYSGTINQSAWGSLTDGNVTLTFGAKDAVGNIRQVSVIVVKSTSGGGAGTFDLVVFITSPMGIAIVGGTLGAIGIIGGVLFTKRKRKLKGGLPSLEGE